MNEKESKFKYNYSFVDEYGENHNWKSDSDITMSILSDWPELYVAEKTTYNGITNVVFGNRRAKKWYEL